MKKIFDEKQINSLLFKIKQGSIDTVRRIIFPVGEGELREKLTEIGELSRSPKTTVRPSIVTTDGVAYHFDDKGEIREISKSKEKIHGAGKIEILNIDERNLNEGESLKVSIDIKTTQDYIDDIAIGAVNNSYGIKSQDEINEEILNSLPSKLEK